MTSIEYERFRVANPHFYLAPFDLLNEAEIESLTRVDPERLCSDMTAILLSTPGRHGPYWHVYCYPIGDALPIGNTRFRCEERGCYGLLIGEEQNRVGLCAKHLQIVKESLPE